MSVPRQATRTRVLIMGAAGRDFHNFNTVFRDHVRWEVVAFTAAQIPDIAGRRYPASLAGALYPAGTSVFPESELPELIRKHQIRRSSSHTATFPTRT